MAGIDWVAANAAKPANATHVHGLYAQSFTYSCIDLACDFDGATSAGASRKLA